MNNSSTFKNLTRAVVLVAAAITVLAVSACNPSGGGKTAKQSVYDRVITSGTIRASYANYPPYAIKDPNTGKLSGIFVDVLEEAGRRLGLKVSWVEEVGYGTIFEGLNSDREDIFGAGVWRNSTRGKVGDFSDPLFYNVINAYGRAGETRFGDLLGINNSVKISTQDGAIDDIIAKSDFPTAQRVSVSQLNPWSDVLLNIVSKKADLTFAEPAAVNLYLDKNPGTLKNLAPNHPLRVFANAYAFKLGEPAFKSMINSALQEIENDGTLDRILRKYEKHPGEFYRLASPYQMPASGTQ